MLDKLAISVRDNEIDKVIQEIENKTEINLTSVKMIQEKIDFLKTCNKDERNKYLLDIEQRVKNLALYEQELYNWYTSDTAFGDKEWDSLLMEIKDNELRKKYDVPIGLWESSEPLPKAEIGRVIKLCGKWVNKRLNCEEAEELFFLIDEFMDSDIHYVLYGFTHSSINSPETYEKSLSGIYEVGVKKQVSDAEKKIASGKAFEKYW